MIEKFAHTFQQIPLRQISKKNVSDAFPSPMQITPILVHLSPPHDSEFSLSFVLSSWITVLLLLLPPCSLLESRCLFLCSRASFVLRLFLNLGASCVLYLFCATSLRFRPSFLLCLFSTSSWNSMPLVLYLLCSRPSFLLCLFLKLDASSCSLPLALSASCALELLEFLRLFLWSLLVLSPFLILSAPMPPLFSL